MKTMRCSVGGWVVAAALVAAMTGCEQPRACTTRGCGDGASITVRRADGALPAVGVSLNVDGRVVECAAPPVGGSAACDTDVTIAARERVSCTEESDGQRRTLTCVPTGEFEQVVSVRGTPASIRAVARTAGGVVVERTFTPQYRSVQPNGPDCEPVCRQWSEEWTLP